MKTSNKILVSAFVLALLILVSVHLTLYAKYKKGEFSVVPNEWQPNLATLSLDNVKYLSVNNIENVTLHLSDSSKIAYEKPGTSDDDVLSFTTKNDTLFVTGKNNTGNIRWFRRTDVYISQNLPLHFVNSQVHLSQRKGMFKAEGLAFSLDSSSLHIDKLGNPTSKFLLLTIAARNKSHVSLNDTYLNSLQLNLSNSSVEEEHRFNADSIEISTDAVSKIAFRAQNLTKAKLTDHE